MLKAKIPEGPLTVLQLVIIMIFIIIIIQFYSAILELQRLWEETYLGGIKTVFKKKRRIRDSELSCRDCISMVLQIGSTLASEERLSKCPRCSSPVRTSKDRARCTDAGCGYDVCVRCGSVYHAATACRPLPRPASSSIGSRASKKRLERLCR